MDRLAPDQHGSPDILGIGSAAASTLYDGDAPGVLAMSPSIPSSLHVFKQQMVPTDGTLARSTGIVGDGLSYGLVQCFSNSNGPWNPMLAGSGIATELGGLPPPFTEYRDMATFSDSGTIRHDGFSDSGYGTLAQPSVGIPSTYSDMDWSGETQSIFDAFSECQLQAVSLDTASTCTGDDGHQDAHRPEASRHLAARSLHRHYCEHCQTHVKTRSELKKHDARHRKPHQCDVPDCTRTGGFMTLNDLARHKKSVHQAAGTRYRCQLGLCKNRDKLWPRADNFRQHLSKVHKRTVDSIDDLEPYIDSSGAPDPSLCNNTVTERHFLAVHNRIEDIHPSQEGASVSLGLPPPLAPDHPTGPSAVTLDLPPVSGSSIPDPPPSRLLAATQSKGWDNMSMNYEHYAVGIPENFVGGPALGHEEYSHPPLHDWPGWRDPNLANVSVDTLSQEPGGSLGMILAAPADQGHLTRIPLPCKDVCFSPERPTSTLGLLGHMDPFVHAFSTWTDTSTALTGPLISTPDHNKADCPSEGGSTDLVGSSHMAGQSPTYTSALVDLPTRQEKDDFFGLREDEFDVACMDVSRSGIGDYGALPWSMLDAVLPNDATARRHSVLHMASVFAPVDQAPVGLYAAHEEHEEHEKPAEDGVEGDDGTMSVHGEDSASVTVAAARSSGSETREDRQGCRASGPDLEPCLDQAPASTPCPDPRPGHGGITGRAEGPSPTCAEYDEADTESADDLDLDASETSLLLACLQRRCVLQNIIKHLGHQQIKDMATKTQHKSGSRRPVKSAVKCDHCSKTFARSCELKKHMKRHEKPYGCTFPRCKKSFGSKNDWKRHENSQHYQLEFWRCEEVRSSSSARDIMCGKLSHSRDAFRAHLGREHGVTDTELVERRCQEKRLGRNCEGRFWCGFCRKTIEVTPGGGRGGGAWSERFDHIEPHFLGSQGFEKKGIKDWVHVDPELPDLDFPLAPDVDTARLRPQREESPDGLDDNVLGLGLTTVLSSMTAARKKRSRDEEDTAVEAAKRQRRDSEQWHCCSCGSAWDVTSSSYCHSNECSNHERCNNCMISSPSLMGEVGV